MNFVEAIRSAHHYILTNVERSLVLGLGVNYPNGADGTTKGLAAEFPGRVLDTPTSELAFTGAAVGMASQGLRPIVHHGRVEFALLAFEQIFTQAARWDFMFGGAYPCPVVLRICVGRQWGNGPQHTANYHSIFMQAPGLDVYVPATPEDAYWAMVASSRANRPAVILEHRWLYQTRQEFGTDRCHASPAPFASTYGDGRDFSIVTYGDGLVDSLKALTCCTEKGIHGKVICLKFFSGFDRFPAKLIELLAGARHVVAVDSAPSECGLLSGVVAHLAQEGAVQEARAVRFVAPPFRPCPTSPKLVGEYYQNPRKILASLRECGLEVPDLPPHSFDELNLAPPVDFTPFIATHFIDDRPKTS